VKLCTGILPVPNLLPNTNHDPKTGTPWKFLKKDLIYRLKLNIKTMKKVLFTASFLLFFILAMNAQADKILGVWITASDSSSVEIIKHTNGKYIGHINWLMEPLDENGKPKVDKENPDPAKRNDQILGLKLLRSFEYNNGKDRWEDGTIYDPDNGKTYSCYMWFEDGNYDVLYLKGYVLGMKFLGRETVWNRKK